MALPEKYMSKGQKAQAKTVKEYDFAAMVGRPRDTRYDIDEADSEEDEEVRAYKAFDRQTMTVPRTFDPRNPCSYLAGVRAAEA